MLHALQAFMPEGVEWTRPEGGMFVWLQLPSGMDSSRLLQDALDSHVAFVPGGTRTTLLDRARPALEISRQRNVASCAGETLDRVNPLQ